MFTRYTRNVTRPSSRRMSCRGNRPPPCWFVSRASGSMKLAGSARCLASSPARASFAVTQPLSLSANHAIPRVPAPRKT